MGTDELISQILTWLDEDNKDQCVDAALDVLDRDWVRVIALQDQADLVKLTYRKPGLMGSGEEVELLCARSAIKAVRRRRPDIFDRVNDNSSDDDGLDLPF